MRIAAKTKVHEIQSWLDGVIQEGACGDRLPTAKVLMKRFQTGQKNIRKAMAPYINKGSLVSRRGLGTIIAPTHAVGALEEGWEGDLLVLRRTSESSIAPHLIRSLERNLKPDNFSMLQIGYTDERQALAMLSSLGRFKTCLLQSHFEKLSIDFLAALNHRVQHIVVDGASVPGLDVDCICTDWRGVILNAFKQLRDLGHERIALLTSAQSAQSILMARREFRQCAAYWGIAEGCPTVLLDALPGDYCSRDIAAALQPFRSSAHGFEFSALLTWGVVEGVELDLALQSLGVAVPTHLSVLMLGSSDSVAGHLGKFDVIGNRDQARLACFVRVLRERMSGVNAPTKSYYLNVESVVHGSAVQL